MTKNSLNPHHTQSSVLSKSSATLTEQDWAWWHSLDDVWKKIFTAHIYHGDKVCSDDFFWGNRHLIDKYGTLNLLDNSDLTKILQLKNICATDFYQDLVDIQPLSRLTQLTKLYLDEKQIQDISPLVNLTQLTRLNLSEKPNPRHQLIGKFNAANHSWSSQ